jgi:hypothetical protein
MTTSCVFIIRGNIDRYRLLIAQETDATRRKTIHQLLAEAEAELKAMQARRRSNGTDDEGPARDPIVL